MTTNANAPVDTRHKDMAAKASNWVCYAHIPETPYFLQTAILAHAQTLANLEAANNRLAEIEQFARDAGIDLSGHTPSPCPGCAAKDEAMAAFKAKVSDAVLQFEHVNGHSCLAFRQFIIPPADSVAEELRSLCDRDDIDLDKPAFDAILEWAKSRLPLGGA